MSRLIPGSVSPQCSDFFSEFRSFCERRTGAGFKKPSRNRGGVLQELKKRPFWENSLRLPFFLGEKFDAEYIDCFGRTHRARVKSGFFQGVTWLEDVVVENNRIN